MTTLPTLPEGTLSSGVLQSFVALLDTKDPNTAERIRAVNERVIADAMRRIDVSRSSVCFSGGGDSGGFESPTFQNGDGEFSDKELPSTAFICVEKEYCTDARTWVTRVSLKELPLDEVVSAVVEAEVEQVAVNWWDSEGGEGQWCMDVASGETTLSISLYIVETSTEHFAQRGIGQLDGCDAASVAAIE